MAQVALVAQVAPMALEDPVAHPHLTWDNQEVLADLVDLEVGWDPVDQVVSEVPMGQEDQERHP